jgi:predicted NodU family carbamoyl transferase
VVKDDHDESPWILGISASHNGAFCLIHGDEIVVAIQGERLVRRKRSRVHGARPSIALHYCLDAAGISIGDLSMIVLSALICAPWWRRHGATSSRRSLPTTSRCCST